jgi:uncharacterized membrane protein
VAIPRAVKEVSRRRLRVYVALAASSLFAISLVFARYAYSHEPRFAWVIWNLFLAWIPFVLAIAIYDRYRAGARLLGLSPLLALWLLFLPNAPYIVTDFKHVYADPPVPMWFDIVIAASAAWTGMLLGFFSLYLVQAVVRRAFGAAVAWAAALVALGLSSFGIYLGRVLRWNSWDVLVDPTMLARLVDVVGDRRAVAMTVLLTGFLTLSYVVVYTLVRLDALEVDE